MKIAIEGCAHGELDAIYATLQALEAKQGITIDLLICCGDFQAIRNEDDLECMSVPLKFRQLGTFYKYYSGEVVAPYPTVFIGGNHEAANYLWELYHGGWAAPNIYFMGYAGVINFGGVRIGGVSGIWSGSDFRKGHFEKPPYHGLSELKSAYHVREYDCFRLRQLQQPVDVFISHDWPRGIYRHGNAKRLIQNKKFFEKEVKDNSLGSPANETLLEAVQPAYWFSAHLHCKFAAVVNHATGRTTKFLALDKCLPRRDFLQLVDIVAPADGAKNAPPTLEYDEEWLAIVRANHAHLSLRKTPVALPGMASPSAMAAAVQSERAWVKAMLERRGHARVPSNFERTAAAHDPSHPRQPRMPSTAHRNPQTVALLQLLELPFNLDLRDAPRNPPPCPGAPRDGAGAAAAAVDMEVVNPEEISLDDDDAREEEQLPADEESGAAVDETGETFVGRFAGANAEEIDLGDDED